MALKPEAWFLARLDQLSPDEMRSLNRYYLHPRNQRCCNECLRIFDSISDNFHVKKHTSSGISYNVKCASCFNAINLARRTKARSSPEAFIKGRFSGYLHRARSMGIPFNLTKDHLVGLWRQQNGRCFYTNEEILFTFITQQGTHPHLRTPSLDRLVPELGYTIGNVVWCSYGINRMKNDLDYETFISACQLVLTTRSKDMK